MAVTRVVCSHCLVPRPAREVIHGLCIDCLPEEGPPPDPKLEEAAVAACRAGGIAAHARPCSGRAADGRLTGCCAALRAAQAKPVDFRWSAANRAGLRRYGSTFTERDELELETFFRNPRRSPMGSASGFGQMCARIGEAVNRDSLTYLGYTVCDLHSDTYVRPGRPKHSEWLASSKACSWCAATERPRGSELPQPPATGASPIAFREIEVNGRLVQVSVLGPVHTPRVLDSERIEAHATVNSVRAISRDDEPLSRDERAVGTGPMTAVTTLARWQQYQASTGAPVVTGGTWDDAMVAYIHAGRRMRRVGAILERLTQLEQDVLEARYSPSQEIGAGTEQLGQLAGVALLTQAVQRLRAEESCSERDVLRRLTVASKGGSGRAKADEELSVIRREALALLTAAQGAYVAAARMGE